MINKPSLRQRLVNAWNVFLNRDQTYGYSNIVGHRSPGKKNNNYHMSTYDEVMKSGDNAPNNVIPGDLNSILIQVINREDLKDLEFPVGPMPPSKALKPEIIDIFTRWILGGAPNSAAEAAAASPPAGAAQPTTAASPPGSPTAGATQPAPTPAPGRTPAATP